MPKLLICIFSALLLFSGNLFSQSRKCLKNNAFAAYNVLQFIDQKVVDSETTVTTLLIYENGLKRLIITRTDFDPVKDTFITTRLNVRHIEIYRDMKVPYVKWNGDLYRLRSEKNGGDYNYFLDKYNPTELDFTFATTPFFTGSKKEGYTSVCDLHVCDSYYVLTVHNGLLGVEQFSINTFDRQFKLVAKKNVQLKKTNKVTYKGFHSTISGDNLYLYYNYYDPVSKSCSIQIVQSNGASYKEVEVKSKPNEVNKNYILYQHNDQLFLYLLKANNDSKADWNTSVFLIDPETGTVSEKNSSVLPLKTILTACNLDKLTKYQIDASYNLFDFYVDSTNNVYLFSFCCNYLQSLVFDCVVTKVNTGEVVWNQYIKTDMLSNQYYGNCFQPALPFSIEDNNENEIIMKYWMLETKKLLGPTTKGNYVIKKITLEEETGKYHNGIGYD